MGESNDVFASIVGDYGDIRRQNQAGLRAFAHAGMFADDGLTRVLDVGNGGARPEEMLSPEEVDRLELFVGVDVSVAMLGRNRFDYRVAADAFRLPFKPGAFDAVIVWEVLHHFGLTGDRQDLERLADFFQQLGRLVGDQGRVYIVEPSFPSWAERLQRLAYRLFFALARGSNRTPPAYIFARQDLKRLLRRCFDCEHLEVIPQHRLLGGRWRPYAPLIFLGWLRLPGWTIPSSQLFCRARSKGREKGRPDIALT